MTPEEWTEMGKFNSDDHYIYYYGQESLRRSTVTLTVNKSLSISWVQSQNNRMITVCIQGKIFSITVIQVYAPNFNAEEAERFNEDLQELLELILKTDVLFIIGYWNAKVGSQEIP